MDIRDVPCGASHQKAQSVIPVPLKMEQGADYFSIRKTKLLYKLRRGKKLFFGRLSENCITCTI